jgi:hypothetical protein
MQCTWVVTEPGVEQERLHLVALTPGLPAACYYLGDKNVIGHYILTMNGVRIRSVTDIQHILHNYHAPEPEQLDSSAQDHATACVVWELIAESFDTNEASLDIVTHEASLDNVTQQVSFATSSPVEHTPLSWTTIFINGGGTDPCLAFEEMEWHLLVQLDDDIIAFVWSIFMASLTMDIKAPIDDIISFVQSTVALDLSPICPKF